MSDPNEALSKLSLHIERKSKLYDGWNASQARDNPFYFILLATEELGEISSALIRERYELAREECIDLAHCALLLWRYLDEHGNKQSTTQEKRPRD